MQWEPIETAPKDGTYILLTDANCQPCWLIAKWIFDRWWGQATSSGKSIIWNEATHWMPLPQPPSNAALTGHRPKGNEHGD